MTVRERIVAFIVRRDESVDAEEVIEFFRQQTDGPQPDRGHVAWMLADCARKGQLVRVARGRYIAGTGIVNDAPRPKPLPAGDSRVAEARRALKTLIARKREELEAIRDERDRYEEIILELERRLERSKPDEQAVLAELDRLEGLHANAAEILGAVASVTDAEGGGDG